MAINFDKDWEIKTDVVVESADLQHTQTLDHTVQIPLKEMISFDETIKSMPLEDKFKLRQMFKECGLPDFEELGRGMSCTAHLIAVFVNIMRSLATCMNQADHDTVANFLEETMDEQHGAHQLEILTDLSNAIISIGAKSMGVAVVGEYDSDDFVTRTLQ